MPEVVSGAVHFLPYFFDVKGILVDDGVVCQIVD